MKNLLKYTLKLKHLTRTGWLRHNINSPETVAAHSWQMAMMALQLSQTEKTYDFTKVIKLCLCHDMGESIIGDITPLDVRYANKKQIEQEAISNIAKESDFAELASLFLEYENNQTPEAKLANDLDKLDMYVQALDYEAKYQDKSLDEFKQSAIQAIQTELGKKILQNISDKA